ncbi:MAG: CDP-diacylglycerol--glycerol-3-phosphate 3-phosphatidyltransferase [Deltaproteobacteria bacterium]|nr:CDP-diacylglycerol--glycerol-3-phosphate 3-phosphatidyltransferase [Deltaproteobacteria bacterium]
MPPINRKVLFNVPNLMSLGRIGAIPIIMAFMMLQGPHRSEEQNRLLSYLSAIPFIAAAIFDLIDGYWARKYGQVSTMGKLIDPMADKLIHMAVMIMLIPMGRFPAWLCVILLFREFLITGLRSVAAGEGMIIQAAELGKQKTAWTNVGLSGLLLHYPILGISTYTVGWVCVGVGVFFNIVSGIQYVMAFLGSKNK